MQIFTSESKLLLCWSTLLYSLSMEHSGRGSTCVLSNFSNTAHTYPTAPENEVNLKNNSRYENHQMNGEI